MSFLIHIKIIKLFIPTLGVQQVFFYQWLKKEVL